MGEPEVCRLTGHDLIAHFLKGMAYGCGFIVGLVLTFSAFALVIAVLSPVAMRWLLRVL